MVNFVFSIRSELGTSEIFVNLIQTLTSEVRDLTLKFYGGGGRDPGGGCWGPIPPQKLEVQGGEALLT